MKSLLARCSSVLAVLLFTATTSFAHCEIPCGIYDDELRVKLLAEHISTIEKSMGQILDIEQAEKHNANQLVRWVMNKEAHADQFQEIVTQYFMTQRLKPDAQKYSEQLTILHQMLLVAMKAKQTTDLGQIAELRKLLADFEKLYFAPHS